MGRGVGGEGGDEPASVDAFHFRTEFPVREQSGSFQVERRVHDQLVELRGRVDELETLGTGRSQWFFISSNVLRIHISKISTPTIGKFMTFSPVGATRSLAYRIKLYMINVKNVKDDFCVIYNIILKLFQRELI